MWSNSSPLNGSARLDLGQRTLLEWACGDGLSLHLLRDLHEGAPGVEHDSYGHGVHEEPDHRLDARHLGWPTGSHCPEYDVAVSAVSREQEAPGRLDERVRRYSAGGAERLDPAVIALGDAHALLAAIVRLVRLEPLPPTGKRGAFRESSQALLPEGQTCGLVRLLQPSNELLEGRRLRKAARLVALQAAVDGEQLAEHDAGAPTVEQNVVVAEVEDRAPRSAPKDGEPEQDVPVQVEQAIAVLLLVRSEERGLTFLVQVSDVLVVKLRAPLFEHDLQQPVGQAVGEHGTEYVVAGEQPLEALAQ